MDSLLEFLNMSLENYPLVYTIIIAIFIGAGIAWGLKTIIENFVDYWLVLKTNQESIKDILNNQNKDMKNYYIEIKECFTEINRKIDMMINWLFVTGKGDNNE